MRSALPAVSPRPLGRTVLSAIALAVLLVGCGGGDDNGPAQVPDTQPPTVTILEPAAGPVSGSIAVRAAAFDNRGVVGVQFTLDGVALGAEDTSAPYEFTWNTSTATNGAHALSAVARDAAGYEGTAPDVTVSVSGGI